MKLKFLDEKNTTKEIGSKAFNLSLMKQNNFTIPNAFVIIKDKNKDFTLLEKKQILKLLKKLKSDKVAIRSSSSVEDSKKLSWAGQFKTFLNIDKKNTEVFFKKIIEVFDSVESPTVSWYKKNNNVKEEIKISVIIQEMISSEKSGVAFSINPLTLNNEEIAIDVAYGLGKKVVDGEINPEEFILNKEKFENKNKNKNKNKTLSKKELKKLWTEIRKIENFFNYPVDIEWAIKKNILYILQVRPIILKNELQIFDNSNISESYAGYTSVLSFSFAKEAYREVYKEFSLLMGASKQEVKDNNKIYENMIQYFSGHFYYNLLNWYKMISIFPAYKVSAEYMEKMMGVEKKLKTQVTVKNKNNFIDYTASFWKLIKIIFTFATLEKKIKKFNSFFDDYYKKENQANLKNFTINDLEKRYRKIENDLIKNWNIPIANDFAVMLSVGMAEKKYFNWTGEKNFFDFIKNNEENFISIQPGKELIKLIKLAKEEEIDFEKKNLIDYLLTNKTKFSNLFFEYQKKYSIRIPNELKLESETLEEKPEKLLQIIRENLKNNFEEKSTCFTEKKNKLENIIFWKKWILNFLFNWSKSAIKRREESRFRRGQAFNLVRKVFIQAGNNLKKENKIDGARDIFFLTVNEIFYSKEDFKKIIARRKKEKDIFNKINFPKRLEFYSSKKEIENFLINKKKNINNLKNNQIELFGKTTSRGKNSTVKSKIIVMKDFNPKQDFKNKILVTEHTDPGWTPIFPLLKGIVIENGGMLSHASIVAREFGIPCIAGVKNATLLLKNIDEVVIDTDGEKIIII